MRFDLGTLDSGERSLPFGLLVFWRLLTLVLLALEWRTFYTFELEYLRSQLVNPDHILCVALLGMGRGCIMFWDRLDQNSGVHGNRKPPLTYNEKKRCLHLFSVAFDPISFLYLQVTGACIKSRTSSNFGQIGRLTRELAALEHLKNFPYTYSGKMVSPCLPLILELLALEWRKCHTFELEYLWSQSANLDQILCVASLGWGKGCKRFWGWLNHNSGFHGNRKPRLTYNGENDVSTFSRFFFFFFFFFFFSDPLYTCR